MENRKHKIFITFLIILLFLPVIGSFIYSISTKWSGTILPEGITIKWYFEMMKSPFLAMAMIRTILICTLSLAFIVIIMVPTIFIISYYFPKLEKYLELLVLICFAVPGAVSVVGLLKIYSGSYGIKLTGNPLILPLVYFIVAFPFMYRGIKNNLNGLPIKEIVESASILGASTFETFLKLIIPNIKKGILVSSLLTFSILFGEFLLVNMLVGGSFQTMQMFINSIRGRSGHISSAVVTIYFLTILLLTYMATKLQNKKSEK